MLSRHAVDARGDEIDGRLQRKTLLPRLRGAKDWTTWTFKAETILKKIKVFYIVDAPAPTKIRVEMTGNEQATARGQRAAQLAYETELKNQGLHDWGDAELPCLSLPAIPQSRLETDDEFNTAISEDLVILAR